MHRTIFTITSMILIAATSAPALAFTPPEGREGYPSDGVAGSSRNYIPRDDIGGPEGEEATGVR